MCKLLDIPRSSLYYNRNKNLKKKKFNDHYLTDLIKKYLKTVETTMVQERLK